MKVAEILRKKGESIFAVRPESTLREAVKLMAERRIGCVIVADADELVGILSERDLVRILSTIEHNSRRLPVSELCTKRVVTCNPQHSIEDVMTLMSNNSIRHLPVVRDGRVVAMISARDVLDAQKETLLSIVERQKRAYSLVLRAKDQAEQASREKSGFLNRVSHELRTPLHAIIGFSELIAHDSRTRNAPPTLDSYVGEVLSAGHTLLGIVNDILDMSRLQIGDWEAADEHLEVGAIAAAAVDDARDAADEAGLALDFALPDAPVGLIADGAMVRQMLDNLLSNAIKFTPRGGTVTVSLTAWDEDGLRISVTDTGIGIPAEALPRVVLPFHQAEDSLTRDHGGAGLGLAIVDSMMAMHDGKLEIHSAPGEGTTAALRFPQRRMAAPPDAGQILANL